MLPENAALLALSEEIRPIIRERLRHRADIVFCPFATRDVGSLQSALKNASRSVPGRRMRVAGVLLAISVPVTLGSVFLYVAVAFGFAAGDYSPNASPDEIASLSRAANVGLALFGAVLILLASVVVKAGVLKTELHWTARAGGAFVVGAIMSYFEM
jgi:hypothetical protein